MDSVGCGGAPGRRRLRRRGRQHPRPHRPGLRRRPRRARAAPARCTSRTSPRSASAPAIRAASAIDLPGFAGDRRRALGRRHRGLARQGHALRPLGARRRAGALGLALLPAHRPGDPARVTEPLIARAGLPGTLCNAHASGMPVIRAFGAEHIATGKPILYTSADSVLQIAAHETHFGLDRLYELCRIAAEIVHPLRVGRVIARPFVGETRRDLHPHRRTAATSPSRRRSRPCSTGCVAAGGRTHAIGKIGDIFAHRGISTLAKGKDDMALVDATLAALDAGGGRRPHLRQLRRLRHALRPPPRRRRLRPRARGLRRPPPRDLRAPAARRPPRHHRRPRQRPDLARHRPHPRAGPGARASAPASPPRALGLVGFADVAETLAAHLGLAAGPPRAELPVTDWAALPKVELHLHLEGAAPPAFIRGLAAEKGVDLSGIFDAQGGYAWTDFAEFLRAYEAACSVLTDARGLPPPDRRRARAVRGRRRRSTPRSSSRPTSAAAATSAPGATTSPPSARRRAPRPASRRASSPAIRHFGPERAEAAAAPRRRDAPPLRHRLRHGRRGAARPSGGLRLRLRVRRRGRPRPHRPRRRGRRRRAASAPRSTRCR